MNSKGELDDAAGACFCLPRALEVRNDHNILTVMKPGITVTVQKPNSRPVTGKLRSNCDFPIHSFKKSVSVVLQAVAEVLDPCINSEGGYFEENDDQKQKQVFIQLPTHSRYLSTT
jgi:hypothetical protein